MTIEREEKREREIDSSEDVMLLALKMNDRAKKQGI